MRKVKDFLWPEPKVSEPSDTELELMLIDELPIEATDGCIVEMDGVCPHGYPSWMLYMGLV